MTYKPYYKSSHSVYPEEAAWVYVEVQPADIFATMWKLDLMDAMYASGVYERMWDADEMMEVNDLVGYRIYGSE